MAQVGRVWFVVLFFGLLGMLTAQEDGTLQSVEIVDVNAGLRVAVLNVGRQAGARVGMPFVVLRGERAVAELKVVEVRDKVCGAAIEKVEKGVSLKAGDRVQVTRN